MIGLFCRLTPVNDVMKPDVGAKGNQKAIGKRLKTLGDYSTEFEAPAATDQ
jgi:hypothetical protein